MNPAIDVLLTGGVSGRMIPPATSAVPTWICDAVTFVAFVSVIVQYSVSRRRMKFAVAVAVVVRGVGRSDAPSSDARNVSVTGPAGDLSSLPQPAAKTADPNAI